MTQPPYTRILLTGAAGRLGRDRRRGCHRLGRGVCPDGEPGLRRLGPGGGTRPDLCEGRDVAVVVYDPEQLSNPINVKISQYGGAFIQDFDRTMQVAGEAPPELTFHQGGSLILANTPAQEQTLRD